MGEVQVPVRLLRRRQGVDDRLPEARLGRPRLLRATMMRERLALAPRLRSRGWVNVSRYDVLYSWEALAEPGPNWKEESLSSPFRSTE